MDDQTKHPNGVDTGALTATGQGPCTQGGGDSALADAVFDGWPAEYIFERRLRRTGQGQVFQALRSDGVRVAIKQVPATETRELIESHALQTLTLDGVAEFIEEVRVGESRLLITRWIEGHAFPGQAAPMAWTLLEPTLRGLLDVIGRVHASGYVHRDLKPGNVLVHGKAVTVLDFGLAWSVDGPGITRPGVLMGTPAYLAPEQIDNSDVPSPATDLWAIGVMAFEALTGSSPFPRATWRSRGVRRAPRLAERPDLDAPSHVLRCIDSLLERRAFDRPASVAAVLHALDNPGHRPQVPWVGTRASIDAVVTAAKRGESVRIVGPGGSGRTRTLIEVDAQLRAQGIQIAWCPTGHQALDFGDIVAAPPATLTLEQAIAWVGDALSRWLGDPDSMRALLVDDWESLPLPTRTVLDGCRSSGVIISAHLTGQGVATQPLDTDGLATWFADPERVLRIPSRAAARLHRRSGGRARLIVARLVDWQHRSLALPAGERWSVRSPQLAELGLAAPVTVLPGQASAHPDTLAWLTLAEGCLNRVQLCAAIGCARWRLDAELAALERADAIFWSGTHPVALQSGGLLGWTLARRTQAHAAIAKACASEADQVRHSWLADPAAAAPAMVHFGAQALARGQIETARAACNLVVKCQASRGVELAESLRSRLLSLLTQVALVDGRARLIGTALLKLQASSSRAHAAELALLEYFGQRSPDAGAALAAMAPLAGDLERFRVRALMEMADRAGELAARRAEFLALAEAVSPALRHEVQARLAYRGNDFEAAEKAYLRAAETWGDAEAAAAAMGRAASSAMEAFAPDRARQHLDAAQAMCAGFEHPHLAARHAWLERAIAHRLRVPSGLDAELLAAMDRLDVARLTSLVLVAECGLAWQRGDLAAVRALACKAEHLFTEHGMAEHVLLCQAARVAAGETRINADAIMTKASALAIGGIGIQVAALAAKHATFSLPSADLNAMLEVIPGWAWDTPIDLLSVSEALERLSGRTNQKKVRQ